MTAMKQASTDAAKKVDSLIKEHLVQHAETTENGLPVAAVSASDRFSWAKHAGVDLDFVDHRLGVICHELKVSEDKHWAVPRYRMKSRNKEL